VVERASEQQQFPADQKLTSMNSDRWDQVKHLFDELVDLAPSDRVTCLNQVADREVAHSVEQLFANLDDVGSNFLRSLARFSGEPLAAPVGTRFASGELLGGRFEVCRLLGRGGMGEVYEADDRTEGGKVAIKAMLACDESGSQAVARFRREIQLAKRISHPNVCRLNNLFVHESAAEPVLVLSMELIDGETLAARMERGRLTVEETEHLLRQILNGIEAAHQSGIIHRDLKPSNLMLCQEAGECRIKITDFGLARPQVSSGTSVSATNAIVGTLDYMAPEQLEGRATTQSDIYAVGIILFEMLTGQKPFDGTSGLEAAIKRLTTAPARPRQVAPDIPGHWERLILKCLERDPAERFRNVAEVRRAIDGGVPGFHFRHWRRSIRWVALGTAAGALFGLAVWAIRTERGQRGLDLLQPFTADTGVTSEPAVSPGGDLVAYVSDKGSLGNLELWIRRFDGSGEQRLTGDGANKGGPSFSPDGRYLLYEVDKGGLYIISTAGGSSRLLIARGQSGRFSPDGKQVAFWSGDEGDRPSGPQRMYVVNAAGGEPKRLVDSFAKAGYPTWTPDGNHILFQGCEDGNLSYDRASDWYVLELRSGKIIKTGALDMLRAQSLMRFGPLGNFLDNRLLFAARQQKSINVFEATFDVQTWKVLAIQRLTSATEQIFSPWESLNGRVFVASNVGSLAIWQFPVNDSGKMTRVTQTPYLDSHPTLSADGRFLAFNRTMGLPRETWIRDLRRGVETQLTFDKTEKYSPVLSRDGSQVALSELENGRHSIFVVSASTASKRRLCQACGDPTDWSLHAEGVLASSGEPSRIEYIAADGARRNVLAQSRVNLDEAVFSPDERWIAFRAHVGERQYRICVIPHRPGSAVPESQWIQFTGEDHWEDKPRWSEDGRAIYFQSNRDGFNCIWSRRFNSRRMTAEEPIQPYRHFHARSSNLDEVSHEAFNFWIAGGQVVLNVAESRGNIWFALRN
jgi:eukaryotic-like serine/threonine-protein kinase